MISRTLSKWDRAALEQLCAEVVRLAEENERLAAQLDDALTRLDQAWRWGESWQEDFYRACETNGTQPGITIDGHLVAVQQENHPCPPNN